MDFRKSDTQRIHIQGKVDVKALAELLRYFRSLGHTPQNRSELLAMVIEGWAKLLRMNDKTQAVSTAKEAFSILSSHGLDWDSERGRKQRLNLIAQEEQSMVDNEEFLSDTSHTEQMTQTKISIIRNVELKAQEQGLETEQINALIKKQCKQTNLPYEVYRREHPEKPAKNKQPDDSQIYNPSKGIPKEQTRESIYEPNTTKPELNEKAEKRDEEEEDKLKKMKEHMMNSPTVVSNEDGSDDSKE